MKVSALLSGGTREGAKRPTSHTLHYWLLPLFSCLPPLWGISGKSWWGCATRFSNSGSYFRQKLSLSTPVFSPKITYICLKSYQIRILSCFLVHLELKWQIRLYTPVVPLQTIPGSRPKCAKYIPFLDWNGPITLPFEAVHTYMASKREYHPRVSSL